MTATVPSPRYVPSGKSIEGGAPPPPDATTIADASRKHPSLPPGPRMSRLGMTAAWMTRPGPFLLRAQRKYGDTFTLAIGQEPPWLVLTQPDHIREVFTGPPDILQAGAGNAVLRPFLGPASVLLLDGRPHLRQRRLLLPPFHGERMAAYREEMTRIAEAEIERWPLGEPVAMWPRMQAVTLEIIMSVVFGLSEGERMTTLRDELRALLDALMNARTMLMVAVLGSERMERYGIISRRMKTIDELLLAEIRARREAADLASRTDVLSMLLQARHEDGSAMEDRELRDELLTLLVAGHETTATTLSWAIERMVRIPGAWAQLRDGGEEYAESVAMEALRLKPVIPIVNRKLAQPMTLAGVDLPAGAAAVPCIYLVHRRPDIYPEPHRFVPDRFLHEKPGTYSWIPFGGGTRRCIGASFALLEAKLVLAAMARALDAAPVTPQPERTRRRTITLTPQHGARVILRAA